MAAGDIVITVVGNLTNDPELRFTPSGAAVASFTIASNSRYLDKATNEWKDSEPVYMRCSVWRQYAENVAESLTRGTRVIATGRLKQRSYDNPDGQKVGPALRTATAKVTKVARGGGGFGGEGGFGGGSAPAGNDDPWAGGAGGGGNAPAGGGGSWGGGNSFDEPPF